MTPNARRLCMFILPWGKYKYLRLPMGLHNSPDFFQEKMSLVMDGLEFVKTYLDDILVITKTSWEDHLAHLEQVFARLQSAGLKVNESKSSFAQTSLKYLGYLISRDGIQPMPDKVEAIRNMAPPKTRRQLQKFIGMVNFYTDMWRGHSNALAPLTALTSNTAKWQWTEQHQQAFERLKTIITKDVLLRFPDFAKPFDIYTDASDHQLGAVITQDNQPIAFYSRKLNDAQKRYTMTERELLAIVETLKEFRPILWGQRIRVFTDHKNLTCKNFNTDRVLRWRLLLEEYGPELYDHPGENNIVADALSRLDLLPDDNVPVTETLQSFLELATFNAHLC